MKIEIWQKEAEDSQEEFKKWPNVFDSVEEAKWAIQSHLNDLVQENFDETRSQEDDDEILDMLMDEAYVEWNGNEGTNGYQNFELRETK